MSEQSPYEKLGVSEGATFDEIQAAKQRLAAEFEGDQKQLQAIDAAYDAVLMDRLRMRQEGKIKVPDRIRFPEKLVQEAPAPAPTSTSASSAWLKRWMDNPNQRDIVLPAGILGGLSALVLFVPWSGSQLAAVLQLAMALGVATSLYFLYRKENKLGRSVLLSLGGLVLGFVVGGMLHAWLSPLLPWLPGAEVFVSVVTFFVLWGFSSFLR